MRRLARLLRRGLDATAGSWPALRGADALVHWAAHILGNADGVDGATVRARPSTAACG